MMAEKKKFNEWIKDTAQDAKKFLKTLVRRYLLKLKKLVKKL